jgi:C4-dicarboxylate-specific signal transduction histidine kinase
MCVSSRTRPTDNGPNISCDEAQHELERRVLERTSALMKTNEALKVEVVERRKA